MRTWLTITTIALAGCTTGPKLGEFRAPDGQMVKSVKCPAEAQKCFEAAAASCPAPGTYRVISSDSHAGGTLADVLPGPVTWYAMNYVCGPSDGRMPDFPWTGPRYVASDPVFTPQPPAQRRRSTTTTCNRIGNTVSCDTY